MGRELRRVAINFKWPIGQIWKGFLNPFHSQECKSCNGSGLNKETKKLDNDWYSSENARYVDLPNGRRFNDNAWSHHLTEIEVKALVDSNRLIDLTHVFTPGEGWKKKEPAYIPTPDEVNEWSKHGMGHDSCNRWICVKARAEHLGFYGHCEICNGEGVIWQSEEIKKLHDDWKSFDPPIGDGFQLWNTTTEGHPMSPVFDTLEKLCEYLETKKASVFGSNTATKEKWFEMLSEDFVCHKEGNAIFL